MSSAYEKYAQTRFFTSLDGLRALSILAVIWFHTWWGTPAYEQLKSKTMVSRGTFGVDIFFAISGFLITTLLLRERKKYGKISLRDFYIRRSLRIWPLYYAMIALYVVLVLVTEHGTERGHAFFHYLPSYLTYTYTWFGPRGGSDVAIFNFAWSLSTEEQFYLFWPFALVFLRKPWPVVALIALSAAKIVLYYGALQGWWSDQSLPLHIALSVEAPICLGALLAITLHSPAGFKALDAFLGNKVAAPAALALVICCLVGDSPLWMPLTWIVLPCLVGACVIREDNGLAAVLRWRPMVVIGILSYGIYLLNTLVVKAVRPVLEHMGIQHPVFVFPFILGGATLLAWLSYRYFESPFLKLKTHFSRLHPEPAEVAPAVLPDTGATTPVHP